MDAVFLKILNMSITAGWLILAVMVLRILLKKAPKWIRCMLWAFVAIRLACPFSFESVWSLIPSSEIINTTTYSARPYIDTGINAVDNRVNGYLGSRYFEGITVPANHTQNIMGVLSVIWLVGVIALLIYTVVSFFRLRQKVNTAMPLKNNIWLADEIASPFILGVIRPRIYLPSDMAEGQIDYVAAHEYAHLKRGDHFWKPFGFLLLSLNWFNPLCWAAYILLCKDIELACDERVIKALDMEGKKAYSQALLSYSINRRTVAACPLAFGEVGVKERVKGVLNYKKPAFWIVIVAVIACLVTALCLLTNPAGIKITDFTAEGDFKNIFHNISYINIHTNGITYTIDSAEEIQNIVKEMNAVKISRDEISKNRSEGRDCSNMVLLYYAGDSSGTNGSYSRLCFNRNYTQFWCENGIKPTFSYKVMNPKAVEQVFNSSITTGNFATADGADVAGKQYQVISTVYDSGMYSFSVTPSNAPQYFISNDIKLMDNQGNPTSSAWHEIGDLVEIELQQHAFNKLFVNAGAIWEEGYSCSQLCKNNEKAWYTVKDEISYYVLLQKNGEVYVACGYEKPGAAHIRHIFKMEQVGKMSQADTGEYKNYVYANSVDPVSPRLSLKEADKTFQFSYSVFSGYLAVGKYEQTNSILTCRTNDGQNTYVFTYDEGADRLTFISAKSSKIPEYKYAGDSAAQSPVPDGATFSAGK